MEIYALDLYGQQVGHVVAPLHNCNCNWCRQAVTAIAIAIAAGAAGWLGSHSSYVACPAITTTTTATTTTTTCLLTLGAFDTQRAHSL